jgi:hypothetical protein
MTREQLSIVGVDCEYSVTDDYNIWACEDCLTPEFVLKQYDNINQYETEHICTECNEHNLVRLNTKTNDEHNCTVCIICNSKNEYYYTCCFCEQEESTRCEKCIPIKSA